MVGGWRGRTRHRQLGALVQHRLHTSIGKLTPVEYENLYGQGLQASPTGVAV